MKKILKIFGTVILAMIAAVIIMGFINSRKPVVEKNYQEKTQTGGEIEAYYLKDGSYETACREYKAEDPLKKIGIRYPKEMETSEKRYPVIVYGNGSGVKGSTVKYLLDHYASWGFIVIDSEDTGTWSGASADQTLTFLLKENENPQSIFFQHIDKESIGITGHSQGGVCVFNAVTVQSNASLYKTAVPISPTAQDLAIALNWPFDPSKVNIPVLLLAGDGEADANTVIPIEKMKSMYEQMNVPKTMARKHGTDHDLSDSDMDGYVTAWMMWQLQGDEYAAQAFAGEYPELMNNPLYIDQSSNPGE